MSDVREARMEGSGPRSGAVSGGSEASREVRWSARRTEQDPGRREEFVVAGGEGLKSRPAPEADRRLTEAGS